MADNRVRAPYSKTIDLAVLDAALGGHGLSASATEIVAVEGSPVTQKELAAAIAAHTAPPTAEEKAVAAITKVPAGPIRDALNALLEA